MRGARADRPGAPVLLGAVLRARGPTLRERTRLLPRRGALRASPAGARRDGRDRAPGACASRDRGVALELELEEDAGHRRRAAAHGAPGSVWTRKQAGIAARGTLALDGGRAAAQVRRAGGDRRHRRPPRARAPSGAGAPASARAPTAVALAWNLVSGVNDPPTRLRARGVGRRRAARGAAGRRSPTTCRTIALRRRLASCASRPRPSARAATTC